MEAVQCVTLIKERSLSPCSERNQLIWRRKMQICLNMVRDFKGERSCRSWRVVPGRSVRSDPCYVVPAAG